MYYAYVLKCSDESLYAGATNDLEKRVEEHNNGKRAAKYTRGRRPVTLVYSEVFRTLAKARAREAEIKGMTRVEKVLLINSGKIKVNP